MIYMIDHYDSFTYNLVQYLGVLGEEVVVRRNDEVTLEEIDRLKPDLLFLSPGPCSPDETGITMEVIEHYKEKLPIFGVCLGHQALAQSFGGNVIRADKLMHGKSSQVHHDGRGIYQGLSNPMEAMRYHSLIVDLAGLPDCFEVVAATVEGEIMGIRHIDLPIEGVQFHPESIGTDDGKTLLMNLIKQRVEALI
ncbi:aminodeoxychorismate/anthranilate synthase component II [Halobacillus shinanisalinarum]|uniref:Aminodeoxychorismate/anthranilate synthase component II n=1 Tax=Halobacillus shinanisalinarum TaxID=2932258 RepID=A0ABY4H0P2_9BACI|nr:aminodeoxychorismate/anthranilate synthase component II [Halobacillus shinanisalinarum]UOQ92572.1 aminodeoxychorismate/anthranilate synthase component II [Halobacillus shinanisalinarum]